MPRDIQKIYAMFPEDKYVIEYLNNLSDEIITEMKLHFETNVRSIKVLAKILYAMKN